MVTNNNMKYKNLITIFSFAILLIFGLVLSGCSSNSNTNTNNNQNINPTNTNTNTNTNVNVTNEVSKVISNDTISNDSDVELGNLY